MVEYNKFRKLNKHIPYNKSILNQKRLSQKPLSWEKNLKTY